MKIQAAVTHACAAPFQIETVDLAEPKSGEILVKIAACGVCHTDESAQNEQVPTKLPAVLGHEGAGIVEKVGPNVTEFQPGDRVGFSFAYCGQCPACRTSKVSSCRDFNKINFGGVLRDGTSRLSQNGQPLSMFFGQSAFAEYAVVDAESAVKVPYEDIDLGLVAPLGCGIQTGAGTVLNRLKPEFGSSIVVFGCGTVGMSAIMAARISGCAKIIGVGGNDNSLKLALEIGATHVINRKKCDNIEAEIRKITGDGANYAIDTSGVTNFVRTGLHCLAPLGVLAILGITPPMEIDMFGELMAEGKTITGVIEGDAVPVVQSGGQYQIVIGSKVSLAYGAICALPGIDAGSAEVSDGKEAGKPKGIVNTLIQTVSSIFTPLLLVMCGSGVVKGILAICTTAGILTETSGTYIVWFAAADAIFRYMPLALAFSAAKRFNANQFVALAVVAAMCYPSIVGLAEGATFFGITLTAMDYHSSVLPALIVVYVLAKLEGLLKKIVPEFLYSFVMPCVCLIIMVPVSLLVIGPVLTVVANGLAAGYSAIASVSPILPGIVIGGFWNLLVVFGVHWTFIPLMINNVSVYGFDTMICLVGPSNFGQAGAALGVFLKNKKEQCKERSRFRRNRFYHLQRRHGARRLISGQKGWELCLIFYFAPA